MTRGGTAVAAFRSEIEAERLRRAGWRVALVGRGARPAGDLDLAATGPVVILGTCGALVSGGGARRGALVVPGAVVDTEGRVWRPDARLRVRLRTAARRVGWAVCEGRLLQADHVVDTAAERATLAARHRAALVDLESARLASAASAAGREWAVLRFVTDTPERPLGWLFRLFGGVPAEEPGAGAVGAAVARRPWLLPRLIGLARSVEAGRRRSALVLEIAGVMADARARGTEGAKPGPASPVG